MIQLYDSGLQAYRDAENVRRFDADSGAYVDVESGRAQENGVWKEVWPVKPENPYLYNRGDECTAVTGGWDANYCSYEGYVRNNRSQLDKRPDSFYGYLATYWTILYRGTTNKVSIKNYNRLCIKLSYVAGTNCQWRLYIHNVQDALGSSNIAIITGNSTISEATFEMDISGIEQTEVYIFVAAIAASASGGGATLMVHEIWLE